MFSPDPAPDLKFKKKPIQQAGYGMSAQQSDPSLNSNETNPVPNPSIRQQEIAEPDNSAQKTKGGSWKLHGKTDSHQPWERNSQQKKQPTKNTVNSTDKYSNISSDTGNPKWEKSKYLSNLQSTAHSNSNAVIKGNNKQVEFKTRKTSQQNLAESKNANNPFGHNSTVKQTGPAVPKKQSTINDYYTTMHHYRNSQQKKSGNSSTPIKHTQNIPPRTPDSKLQTPMKGTPIFVPNNEQFAIHPVHSPYWKKKTNVYNKHAVTNIRLNEQIYKPPMFQPYASQNLTTTKKPGKEKDLILDMIKKISEKIDYQNVKVPEMQTELRPYQLEGLGWLKTREIDCNGGILADDMGLGKTVSMIALMSSTRKKTLIIVPLPVLDQWEKEIRTKGPPFQIAKFQGANRRSLFPNFGKFDLVITTYNVIVKEFSADGIQTSPIFTTPWGRVILDEAHLICNSTTKSAQACFSLQAEKRWCLSGTLIQNKIEDLFSYFHFINRKDYGDLKIFKDMYIARFDLTRKEALQKFHLLFKTYVLRRTKDAADIITLPPININTTFLEFSKEERSDYNRVVDVYKEKIKDLQFEGKSQVSQALVLLMRTKQVCVNKEMVQHIFDGDGDKEVKIGSVDDDWEDDLAVDIVKHYNAQGSKTIIFSQFTTALNLLRVSLEKQGLKYAHLDGKMNAKQRTAQISKFESDSDCGVLLASLKCASTGLNLTMASNVILLDLWWNPAIQGAFC
ncbi:hypothetical protein HDV01_002357 [Terramyces sp. JEL0728]|nr:hypothetical protein HDV01_002357 [Terramyces sp. JEL0728]